MSFSAAYTSFPYGFGTDASVSSPDVPGLYDVALDGVGYFLDTEKDDFLMERSAPRIRTQADSAERSGETTLNPEGPWLRTFDSWTKGAGQLDADRPNSEDDRFHTSKGVDVWEEWKLTLLPGTKESRTSVNGNLDLAVAGSRLYAIDGGDVVYTTDPFAVSPTWTNCTGEPAATATGIASAGHHVFVAFGASGIYHTEADTAALTSWQTGTVEGVWYVKGRVMTCAGREVFNPTTSWTGGPVALPAALFTHPNDAWTWVDMAEGLNDIYMGGYAGDTSLIYRTAVQEDGTALVAPVVAGRLPEGEVITALDSYLEGFILIGTTKGVRVATSDANGNLQLGALLETGSPVRDFEGQDRFVWFTWENFDAADGGLGRLDLTTTTRNGAPAYASDLMATTTADITSVVTFDGKRVFTVANDGIYVQDTDLAAEGYVTTGRIRFDLTAPKIGLSVEGAFDLTGWQGSGEVDFMLCSCATAGIFESVGVANSGTLASYSLNERRSAWFNIKVRLTRDDTDATKGPVLDRVSVLALPTSETTTFITARLLVRAVHGVAHGMIEQDVTAARSHIAGLHASNAVVSWQDMETSRSVIVEDFAFMAEDPTPARIGWEGTIDIRMKVVT